MSDADDMRVLDRRAVLTMAAGLGVAAFGGSTAHAADGAKTVLTADQALEKLVQGNARFVASPLSCTTDLIQRRASLSASQAPWAVIVGCADSRVPPELLFGGLGLGEVFVARNAGNLVDTATLGTVEYGAAILGAPLIVVLGHERCGAIVAACDVVLKNASFPGSIGRMIAPIVPAAAAMRSQPGDFVDNTVIESAKRTARRLAVDSSILRDLVKSARLKIVAARYDLDDGKVVFFS